MKSSIVYISLGKLEGGLNIQYRHLIGLSIPEYNLNLESLIGNDSV